MSISCLDQNNPSRNLKSNFEVCIIERNIFISEDGDWLINQDIRSVWLIKIKVNISSIESSSKLIISKDKKHSIKRNLMNRYCVELKNKREILFKSNSSSFH